MRYPSPSRIGYNDAAVRLREKFVKVVRRAVLGAAVAGLSLHIRAAGAMELDFLQTDPRFSGGEVNPSDPSHQNFWFYDQYTAARDALQAAGVNIIPVTSLTLASMTADSDAFYFPPPTNLQASTYPLTDQELSVVQQYVASNRSVIFNLGDGQSAAMDNNLMLRLGLTGIQAPTDVSGSTNYPLPNQPSIEGTYGPVNSFTYSGTGYFSSLGTMRALVDVGSNTVIPYIEKGDFGYHEGAYFFILDPTYLQNWSSESSSQQNFFVNMVEYATGPWGQRYMPSADGAASTIIPLTDEVPEPGCAVLAGSAMMLLRRRKRRGETVTTSAARV
jgi:hypothetical protein